MASPWARRMRTHAEWNVAMSGARMPAGASSASTRRAISPAAWLAKVTARTWRGCTPRTPSRWAMRCAMTRVLPLPAPASTSSGPSPARTASRCGGFRSSRRWSSPAGTPNCTASGQGVTDGVGTPSRSGTDTAQIAGIRAAGERGTCLATRSAMRHTKRVLVVDDNEVILDILKQFLGRGYTVEVVGNASLALASVVQKTPDVILLDVRMPGVDGLSLLKSLRDMGVQTPVFVMTGYDSTQVAIEALEKGATGYLPKPFDLIHLDRLIAHALGQPAA